MVGKFLKNWLGTKLKENIYRIRTRHVIVEETEDQSLVGKNREIIIPCDLVIGEEIFHNFINFNERQTTFDEIIDKICNIGPQTSREKEMFFKGFFLEDGSSGLKNYNSKVKFCGHLHNQDFNLSQKLRRFSKEIWNGTDFKI